MQLDLFLVPIDFSPDANEAFIYAPELAREEQARIHILHSWHVQSTWGPGRFTGMKAELRSKLRDAAARKLEKALHTVSDAGLEGEAHLSELPAVDAIVTTAGLLCADLIIMGTRGRAGLSHVLRGSVAERTVRVAPCPVLTLRAKRADH
jgi:nucleotide-binding universal stress UspA family protein